MRGKPTTTLDVERFTEEMLLRLAEHGYKACVLSVHHLRDLQKNIEGYYKQGLLDKDFYRERLTFFDFHVPNDLPEAKSLIVIAVPRPQSQAIFMWNGQSRALILPPTYVAYKKTRTRLERLVAGILAKQGYHVKQATTLPLKLLAVSSGLGSYGRNNICYVPSMGSFLQLVALYSDLPCQKDSWQEVQMMENCQNCHACRQNCPTGAIPSDRFLLRAERCIVFHNEKNGDIPFPVWMDPSWHNCLIGCMRCQEVCPLNREFLQWIEEKEKFSQKETTLFLEGVPRDQLPAATIRKLEHLDFLDDIERLPRNLGVFLTKLNKEK